MMNKEEYYKNRCIQLDKKLDRVIDSHTKLENKINDLQQKIDKVNQIIDELLLMGTNEYEIEEQLEELKRILGGKE